MIVIFWYKSYRVLEGLEWPTMKWWIGMGSRGVLLCYVLLWNRHYITTLQSWTSTLTELLYVQQAAIYQSESTPVGVLVQFCRVILYWPYSRGIPSTNTTLPIPIYSFLLWALQAFQTSCVYTVSHCEYYFINVWNVLLSSQITNLIVGQRFTSFKEFHTRKTSLCLDYCFKYRMWENFGVGKIGKETFFRQFFTL